MTQEEIIQKIKDTFFTMFDKELTDENFIKNWQWIDLDEIDTVELVMRLEADLNVSIPDEFLETFETPENLCNWLTKNIVR